MGPAPGSRIAERFEIESVLGEGAFGRTYLARDLFRRQRVAVKVLAAKGAEIEEGIRTEIRVARALQHPNILSVLESGSSDNGPYIVYEWVEGADLDKVLAEGPLPLSSVIAACLGIAGALRHAHSQGIIHRDLKPANVLVPGWPQHSDFRRVRLLDFGVAGALRPSTGSTRVGMIFGTPVYMSPEQALGEPQTAATDIYGLGLLLYEMLTGRKLREVKSVEALFRAILAEEVPPLPPSIPPAVAQLITESVRRNPAARPTLDRLTVVLEGLLPTAELPAMAQPMAPPAPASVPAPVLPPVLSRVARRPVWAAVAVALAAAAAVMLILALVLRSSSGPSSGFTAVFAGCLLVVVGVAAGFWIRGRLNRSTSELKTKALSLAVDAKQTMDVTATIALEVTNLVGRLREVDERILAGTVALMLNEYKSAAEGKDRQSALMNVVALSEKLGQRLSPWYVRYKDVIATAVAVAGAVSGLLTAYNGLHHK